MNQTLSDNQISTKTKSLMLLNWCIELFFRNINEATRILEKRRGSQIKRTWIVIARILAPTSLPQNVILLSCMCKSHTTDRLHGNGQITGWTIGWNDRWSNRLLPQPGPMPHPFHSDTANDFPVMCGEPRPPPTLFLCLSKCLASFLLKHLLSRYMLMDQGPFPFCG